MSERKAERSAEQRPSGLPSIAGRQYGVQSPFSMAFSQGSGRFSRRDWPVGRQAGWPSGTQTGSSQHGLPEHRVGELRSRPSAS